MATEAIDPLATWFTQRGQQERAGFGFFLRDENMLSDLQDIVAVFQSMLVSDGVLVGQLLKRFLPD